MAVVYRTTYWKCAVAAPSLQTVCARPFPLAIHVFVGRHINLHRTCTFIVLQLFGGLKASCHYCNRRHILVSI